MLDGVPIANCTSDLIITEISYLVISASFRYLGNKLPALKLQNQSDRDNTKEEKKERKKVTAKEIIDKDARTAHGKFKGKRVQSSAVNCVTRHRPRSF
jgi:hypothetical protein